MLRSTAITAKNTPSTVFLRETIRPTCLAFLLAGPDPALLIRAVEICSVLWGGIYNPIIVLDQHNRARLGVQEAYPEPVEQEILGTLKDFDPDFVVTLGTDTLPSFIDNLFGHRHLREQDLTHELRPGQRSGVFLEVWPFLQDFWQHEIRGGPADAGVRLLGSGGAAEFDPFVSAQFGRYAREGANRMMRERLAAQDVVFDAIFRGAFQFNEFWFPIDFTALSLEALGNAAFVNVAFFLLNHTDIFDVVDYWNLRAAGMTVFPLPAPLYGEYTNGVRAFATATKPNLPTHFDGEVIKARSISDQLLEEVQNWASGVSGLKITRHGWYPRFGMEMDFVSPDITPVQIEASSSNQVVVLEDGSGHLMGSTPPCTKFDGPSYFQQWSCELDVYSDSAEDSMYHLPWLRPECDRVAAHYLGHGHGTDAGRVSRTGLVCHREGDKRDTFIQRIPTVDVVKSLLKSAGFTFDSLSSSGLAAERIVAQLGGIHGCHLFRHRGVRDILRRLERGRSLPADEIRATLHRLNRGEEHVRRSAPEVMDQLVPKKVLRVGMVFKCGSCGRHEWYHIADFNERFQCKWCFEEQSTPRLEAEKWHYRADGLFALEGKMAGCLSVLLAILHINTWVSNLHYYPSFNYKDGTTAYEADFICFSRGFNEEVELIVGEAKTSQSLEEHEVVRMGDLAERLDAWLVFCRLEGEFAEADKEHFRRLRTAGRRLILLDGSSLEAYPDEIFDLQHDALQRARGDLQRLAVATTERIIGPAPNPFEQQPAPVAPAEIPPVAVEPPSATET